MTGIVVGLGGKASATSRATSLKNFIRTGESFAEITIFLRNGGPDAYHPELYGATIEVVRRLNHDGTGAYKLKSSSGRIISNKKEELINIMEQFNIQVCSLCVFILYSVLIFYLYMHRWIILYLC